MRSDDLACSPALGAVSILNADVANENQFRTSFCDPADNSNIVWLYWMAGASAAIVPFSICGTIAACLLTTASKQIQTDQHGNIRYPTIPIFRHERVIRVQIPI